LRLLSLLDKPKDDDDISGPIRILRELSLLEEINPCERPASSPLLDGRWTTAWVSKPPLWSASFPLRTRRLTHSLDIFQSNAPGRYTQSCRVGGLLRAKIEGTCTPLGGDNLRIEFDPTIKFSLLGITLFTRPLDPNGSDLDHAMQPTFVDGDTCILRAAAVYAGVSRVLRPERIYILRRERSRYWQPPPEEEPKPPSWLPEA
ncbi:MAG: hypothetical protein SGPRY_013299, partial [Prymnesium sp.]